MPPEPDVRALLAPKARPLVGMVHLPPLGGPDHPGVSAVLERATTDTQAYRDAGFDAVLVENLGDHPYPRDRSDPHVPALMARAVAAACTFGIPVGVNVLRNDARSALAACYAGGGSFVRINVLTGAAVTDQGIIQGDAHGVMAYRRLLGIDAPRTDRATPQVLVLADIHVKHAAPLVHRPIGDVARETVHRAGADVLLVTGDGTGEAADLGEVEQVARAVPGTPVWVASGVTAKMVPEVLRVADGIIVGTAAQRDGVTGASVDPGRAREIAKAAGKTPRD